MRCCARWSGRVRQATRECDQIGRLDGDTFAVLQYNGQAADNLAPRLVDLLGRPYLIRGEVVTIGISVGVARAPADGATAALLMRHADYARHEAKEAGGQTWRHYGHSMADRALLRQELEADLRKALALGPVESRVSAAGEFALPACHRVRGAGAVDTTPGAAPCRRRCSFRSPRTLA